ncbi:MAG: hypothetical protein JWM89_3956 [Acidimicrobiales bacterium]|nr:hypothetical protein [Acidimicrobiales bacterium]
MTGAEEGSTAPTTGRAARRHSALLVQCTAYVAFAAPIGMLGAGWPEARHAYGRSSSALGILAAGYGLGRLATSATALPLLRRWHVRHASTVLLVGLAASCFGVAATHSFAVLVVAMTANGLFGGVLDSIGNHFQTVVRDVGRAGLMFGAYGVGATLGPALVALTSWSVGYAAAGAVALVAAWLAARPPVRWPAAFDDRAVPRHLARQAQVPRLGLAVLLGVFAIYCGIEVVTANWAASFLEEHRHATTRAAGLAVSGFWAGMTLGRLLLGRLRATPNQILGGAAVAVIACYGALAVLPTAGAIVGLVLGGVVLSAMFPALMSTTADRVGQTAAGRVSGWELLAANVSATVLSGVAGLLVSRVGSAGPAVLMAVLAVVGLPLLVWSFAADVSPPDVEVW